MRLLFVVPEDAVPEVADDQRAFAVVRGDGAVHENGLGTTAIDALEPAHMAPGHRSIAVGAGADFHVNVTDRGAVAQYQFDADGLVSRSLVMMTSGMAVMCIGRVPAVALAMAQSAMRAPVHGRPFVVGRGPLRARITRASVN